ncbi:outer membrane beta-barrel protein [Fibrella sp. WM1]|uniref:outer membrane beta-barrel protein n=1 Tax=Fibrella musci TaxID=3242485 RepID=UPI00352135E2
MTTRLLSLLALLAVGLSTQAQAQRSSLSGTLQTADQKPLEGAVVTMVRAADSTFVKAAVTEANGTFVLTGLKPGTFRLAISHVGYQPYRSSPITIDTALRPQTLPPITLRTADQTLNEVTIVAKKPFVEQRLDRLVVNPDALITNAGTNLLDVLEKSPGIQVDANGVISLRGRSGVVVFIDDKPTYLSADDLANYLRSLSSGAVASIEIMTNPPARYDAAGNAGVINIRLKKTTVKGLNGGASVAYGQGRYLRSNNSANLNYRVNKVNFFTNGSVNTNRTYQDLTIWRSYFTPTRQLQSNFTQNSYFKREQNSANLKVGVDWYVSDKTTLGVVLSGFRNRNLTPITNNATITSPTDAVTGRVEALANRDLILRNGSVNLNFTHRFDSTGRELSGNVDLITYRSMLNQSLSNTIFTPGQPVGQSLLESTLPTNITIQTAKLDYTHPLRAGERFEAGAKRSQIETSNVAEFFDVVDGNRQPNYTFTNSFAYHETINAAYLNYALSQGRFSVQAGLRFENTAIRGDQTGNITRRDSSFTRTYNSLFPTFYANYKLDKAGKHLISVNYGRRIDRPDYQSLNPFTYPLDLFTLYGGNPFLRPTFSNNLELYHAYNNKLTTVLRYSRTRDVVTETIEQGVNAQGNNIFYSRPGNIGELTSYGVAVNGSFQPAKWWTLQLYSEVTHNEFQATLYNQVLNNSGAYWYVAPTNLFQLSKSWSAEVAGTYQTKVYTGQFVLIPVGSVRVGASKRLWAEKGTLKMSVSDLFYTNQPGGTILSIANSTARWYSLLDSRVATVALSYRFNNGKTLAPRKTGGAEAEQGRVKS